MESFLFEFDRLFFSFVIKEILAFIRLMTDSRAVVYKVATVAFKVIWRKSF